MNRPRKNGPPLPRRMTLHHGSYYLLQSAGVRRNKRIPLGRAHGVDGKTDAQLLAAALKKYADLIAASDKLAGDMTKLVDAWLEKQLPKYKSEDSRKEYRRMCGHIRTAFFDFHAKEVEPSAIGDFIDDNYADKPNMANKYKSLMSVIFAYGMRKGFCSKNPCVGVKGLPETKRQRYITDAELAAVRHAAMYWERVDSKGGIVLEPVDSGPMIVCFIDLALITAQRHSDVLALEPRDIRPDGIIFYPSKTKYSTGVRVPIRMTAQLRAVLDRAMACVPTDPALNPSKYVIHTVDGRPYSYSGAHSAWVRAIGRALKTYLRKCAEAAIEPDPAMFANMHFHDLKRKALTDAKIQGKDAQRLGGHADPKMTEHYIEDIQINWIDPVEISMPAAD